MARSIVPSILSSALDSPPDGSRQRCRVYAARLAACAQWCSTPRDRGSRRPRPRPGPGQVLLRVLACGVCRTDLHIVDGELPEPKLPLVLGHQIVGEVIAGAGRFELGARVGVPWLGWTDGDCRYCLAGRRTCATAPGSPATTSTAATRSSRSPTSASASRSRRATRTSRPRRSCAPGSSGTARSGSRATPSGSASTASGPRRTSSARSQWHRVDGSSPGRARATTRRRSSRGRSEPCGPETRLPVRRTSSTRSIVFAPVGALVPAALRHVRKEARSSARGST